MSSRSSPRNVNFVRAGVAAGVGVLHLALFGLLGTLRPEAPPILLSRPVEVELVRPSPIPPLPVPPPPQTPPRPAPVAGGGAPAAPSRTHLSPMKNERPPELAAPPKPAPEAPLVIGVAPEASPTPGQGGAGTGSGSGVGAGSGPGAGDGPPRLIQGPTKDQLRRQHPREAFRQRLNGSARIACRIRLDTRLEDCRVVDEAPPGRGFGEAALAASGYFRFRPPTRDGRPVEGREITVGVEFMP